MTSSEQLASFHRSPLFGARFFFFYYIFALFFSGFMIIYSFGTPISKEQRTRLEMVSSLNMKPELVEAVQKAHYDGRVTVYEYLGILAVNSSYNPNKTSLSELIMQSKR